MALSSSFRDRLEQMEYTRNQRLSLLQAEVDLQAKKSCVLSETLSRIRSIEQRCLMLESNIASRKLKILAIKSEIEALDDQYSAITQQLRVFQSEVEELEEVEMEKERFFAAKEREMNEFRENSEKFSGDYQLQVERLKQRVNELKSNFLQFQGNNGHISNAEIAAAELRKSELLSIKEHINRNINSNCHIRAQLQSQLQTSPTSNKRRMVTLSQSTDTQSSR